MLITARPLPFFEKAGEKLIIKFAWPQLLLRNWKQGSPYFYDTDPAVIHTAYIPTRDLAQP